MIVMEEESFQERKRRIKATKARIAARVRSTAVVHGPNREQRRSETARQQAQQRRTVRDHRIARAQAIVEGRIPARDFRELQQAVTLLKTTR